MSRLSRKVPLITLLKVKDTSQWVTEIPAGLHVDSSFMKDRTLMLGSSNCSCQGNRSTYHMLLNHHHLPPLEITLQLHHHHLSPPEVVLQLYHHLSPLNVALQLHHHHLIPLAAVWRFSLECTLGSMTRFCIYPGTRSKFPWSSDVQTTSRDFIPNMYYKKHYVTIFYLVLICK